MSTEGTERSSFSMTLRSSAHSLPEPRKSSRLRCLSTTIRPPGGRAAGDGATPSRGAAPSSFWISCGAGTAGAGPGPTVPSIPVEGLDQGLGLGVADLVGEHRLLDRLFAPGVQGERPLLDVLEGALVRGEHHHLVDGVEREEDHRAHAPDADARLVSLGLQDRVERVGELARGHEDRLDDEAVAPAQQGLVQHLDHVEGAGEGVRAALEQQRVAVGVLDDLEVLAVECLEEHALDLRAPHDPQRHQLEDGAVGGGDLGQGATAHQQGHVARGDVFARGEGEDSRLDLPEVDPVLAENPAGGGEELAGRQGLGKLEGDEVALVAQARRDDEGHAELLAEHRVDEGDQGHVVEADPDGLAAEILTQAVRDALGHGALDDDPRGAGGAGRGGGLFGRQGRRLRGGGRLPWAAGSDPGRGRAPGSRRRSAGTGPRARRRGGDGARGASLSPTEAAGGRRRARSPPGSSRTPARAAPGGRSARCGPASPSGRSTGSARAAVMTTPPASSAPLQRRHPKLLRPPLDASNGVDLYS